MKTRLYFLLIILAGVCITAACKKMDSTYEQYIVKGGIEYPGAAKSAVVRSGNKRAKVVWARGTDPKIVKAKIFWNNFTDSVEVPITADQDTISYTFSDLAENFYSFTIRTYDAKGNTSVPVEVSGNVYGDRYQARVLERPVKAPMLNNANLLKIEWTPADTIAGAFATDVEYTNNLNVTKTVRFKAKEINTEISDYKAGTSFKYRTLYLPDSLAIDTFYTGYLVNTKYRVNKKEWVIKAFDNQHSTGENDVNNIKDGNPATRWHGLASASGTNYPHYFTMDMGISRIITQLSLWRMKDDVRAPDRIQVLTSTDNTNWTDQGTFNFNRFINEEQIFDMSAPTEGRYFKVIGLSGPEKYIVLGEVDVFVR